jgi:ribose 5-phosphate isomerase RpiB
MIIAIGNDHAGVEVKERIQQHLVNKGHQVINKGYDGERKRRLSRLYPPGISRR